jgi:arsenite-transporting ATPase
MLTSRYLFFTGKGGVGKTSVACAMAINLARSGKSVLLVSTDPASNLDDVLEASVGPTATEITAVPGLRALNLDPGETARAYREQVVGSYRGLLPEAAIASIEEQLSGACTVEIAAFGLFTGLLTDPGIVAGYDHVLFDTAPTGHTLRLLSLPKAWSGFLDANTHGTSCIGPLADLGLQRERYRTTVSTLADAAVTTLVLVTKPEASALSEAARASRELRELGMANQRLVVNGVLTTRDMDPVATVFRQQQEEALGQMPSRLKELPSLLLPLLPDPPTGIDGLSPLAELLRDPGSRGPAPGGTKGIQRDDDNAPGGLPPGLARGLESVVAELGRRSHGLVLVMGKGGVGKTTVAAAVALALAERGHRVHLSTTDPAAHLEMALAGAQVNYGDRFSVGRIDPEAEVIAYREEIMTSLGANLDEEGRELLAEDLASPCTEEIAVFRAFARAVDRVKDGFVVMDTAPTGHTLLLLDNTRSYHREVERGAGQVPEEVRRLLPRLRDPQWSHVILVTLAQATPVLEAARLQDDLRRAGIMPDWWVVNQTWSGVSTADPVLAGLARAEIPWVRKVAGSLAGKAVYIPWQARPPKGRTGLLQLVFSKNSGERT